MRGEADGMRRLSDQIVRTQMADVFAEVTPAGAASGAPTKRTDKKRGPALKRGN
jgi:hypothetical protein